MQMEQRNSVMYICSLNPLVAVSVHADHLARMTVGCVRPSQSDPVLIWKKIAWPKYVLVLFVFVCLFCCCCCLLPAVNWCIDGLIYISVDHLDEDEEMEIIGVVHCYEKSR